MHKVGLVDFGTLGNTQSIKEALGHVGADVHLLTNPEQFERVDSIVIPGVGSFNHGMSRLRANPEYLPELKRAMSSKPSLGICLGMQLMAKVGFENQKTVGIEIFDAEVKLMENVSVVPHMGFNQVIVQRDTELLAGLDGAEFYFMHSYEVVNYKDVVSLSSYDNHEFVSSIGRENIFGVQFHPEKSRDPGLQLFENFIKVGN